LYQSSPSTTSSTSPRSADNLDVESSPTESRFRTNRRWRARSPRKPIQLYPSKHEYHYSKKESKIHKRKTHSEIERKYRETINEKLEALRLSIPSLSKFDVDNTEHGSRPSKATILDCALGYIEEMNDELGHLENENQHLKTHNLHLRIMCRGMKEKLRQGDTF
jgi:hypothetical protein